jgi:hypothetical protein
MREGHRKLVIVIFGFPRLYEALVLGIVSQRFRVDMY